MSIAKSFHGAGGRKRATARVFLVPVKTGASEFTVNKKEVSNYFPELSALDAIYQPLRLLGLTDFTAQYHIKATVKGGGKTGQREAVRLGLAKALVMLSEKQQPVVEADEATDAASISWRRQLRKGGLLTRDSRKVEPKRYGLHKARKRAPLVKR